jgi:hypothetical protein
MRIAAIGAALLVPAAALAGCGSSSDTSTTGTSGDPGSPQALVVYVKSGGIAGIYEKLVVDESGRATVSQGLPSRAKVGTFSLSQPEVAALRHTLDAANLESQQNASPQGCADCFVYDITYAGHHFRGDEATLPAQVKPAVTSLNALIAQAGIEEPLATGK